MADAIGSTWAPFAAPFLHHEWQRLAITVTEFGPNEYVCLVLCIRVCSRIVKLLSPSPFPYQLTAFIPYLYFRQSLTVDNCPIMYTSVYYNYVNRIHYMTCRLLVY